MAAPELTPGACAAPISPGGTRSATAVGAISGSSSASRRRTRSGTPVSHPRCLPKHLFDAIEEALVERAHLFATVASVFLEELALARRKPARHLHMDPHQLVPLAIPLEIGDALAFHPKHRPGLRPCGDRLLGLVLEGRHLDLRAECELGERNGDLADDVFSLSREERVLGNRDHYVEIARRTAADSSLTFAAKL